MQEPKLKLKNLKENPYLNHRVIIPIGDGGMLMVDPRDFEFCQKTKPTAGGGGGAGIKGTRYDLIVKYPSKPNIRYTVEAKFPSDRKEAIVKDCLAMDSYSKHYQVWLKEQGDK